MEKKYAIYIESPIKGYVAFLVPIDYPNSINLLDGLKQVESFEGKLDTFLHLSNKEESFAFEDWLVSKGFSTNILSFPKAEFD